MLSRGVKWIGIGWTAFIAENLILSSFREQIISDIGDDSYHLIYNTLSTLACSSIAWGYFKHRNTGPFLSPRGKAIYSVGVLIQTLGLMGVSQLFPKLQIPVIFEDSQSTETPSTSKSISKPELTTPIPSSNPSKFNFKARCPMDFKAPDVPQDGIYGMERISRHSTFWSIGLATMGIAIRTQSVPNMLMFGFPMVFALIGGAHQDHRHRNGSGGYLSPERDRVTSNVPFAAFVRGEQNMESLSSEIKWTNAGIALAGGCIAILKKVLR